MIESLIQLFVSKLMIKLNYKSNENATVKLLNQ